MNDTLTKLSKKTIGLHWIIALMMITMLAVGLYMSNLPRGDTKSFLLLNHKSFGMVVLLLALYRLNWRVRNGFPKPLSEMKSIEKLLAKLVHILLIAGTVFMPISGIVMSIASGSGVAFFGFEIVAFKMRDPDFVRNDFLVQTGGAIHALGGKLLIAAIVLHVAGALKHHLIEKDGTLMRMLGRDVS